jgi:hypothetical protein
VQEADSEVILGDRALQTEDKQTGAKRRGHQNRRSTYLIKPSFQLRFAVGAGLFVALLSATISIVMYGVLHHQARLRLMEPEVSTANAGLVIFLFALAFAALTGAAVCLWCVRVTHRVCGPLAVLEEYFDQLAGGFLPSPRPLRQKDEFVELHAAFAKAIQAMKTRKRTEVAALTEAIHTVEAAANQRGPADEDGLESAVSQLTALRKAGLESLGEDTAWSDGRAGQAGRTSMTPATAGSV